MKTAPKYKTCRRLGPGVYDKCQTQKFTLSESKRSATQKRGKRPRALSDFGGQLLEKQRVRLSYGIPEKQFSRYVKESLARVKSNPADELYSRLESRLDNVIYRTGLAQTRRAARQLVSHGHFMVNGKRVKVPSFEVKKGDTVSMREGSKDIMPFQNTKKTLEKHTTPNWIVFDEKKGTASIKGAPSASDEQVPYDLSSVIEFYRR